MKDRIQRKTSTPNQTEPEAPSPVVSEATTNPAVSGHDFANISVYPKDSSLEHQNESQELEPKRNFLQFGQQFGSYSRPENPNGHDFSSMNIFPPARENRTGLPDNVLQRMENAFGHDFSEVRAQESQEPEAFDARAFARGNELHFRPGELNPQSTSGLKMIGHELTHVVQQREGRARGASGQILEDAGLEAEAGERGARVASGKFTGSQAPLLNTSPQSMASISVIQRVKDSELIKGKFYSIKHNGEEKTGKYIAATSAGFKFQLENDNLIHIKNENESDINLTDDFWKEKGSSKKKNYSEKEEDKMEEEEKMEEKEEEENTNLDQESEIFPENYDDETDEDYHPSEKNDSDSEEDHDFNEDEQAELDSKLPEEAFELKAYKKFAQENPIQLNYNPAYLKDIYKIPGQDSKSEKKSTSEAIKKRVSNGINTNDELRFLKRKTDARYTKQLESKTPRPHLHQTKDVTTGKGKQTKVTERRFADIKNPSDRLFLADEDSPKNKEQPEKKERLYVFMQQMTEPEKTPTQTGKLLDSHWYRKQPRERFTYTSNHTAPSYPTEAATFSSIKKGSKLSDDIVFKGLKQAMKVEPITAVNNNNHSALGTAANLLGATELRRNPFMAFGSAQVVDWASQTDSKLTPEQVFGKSIEPKFNAPGKLPASGTGAVGNFRKFENELLTDKPHESESSNHISTNMTQTHRSLMELGWDEDQVKRLLEEGVPEDFIEEAMLARMTSAATRESSEMLGLLPYSLRNLKRQKK